MTLWIEDLVDKNKYSRPAIKLIGVFGFVIHWTANFGATDEDHQAFFDGSDGGGSRYAGAHFFIDSDSARLIVPLDEVAYHANDFPCRIPKLQATKNGYVGGANLTTIGLEMCVEKDGTIHPNTIKQTVAILARLCKMYNKTVNDIYRHFDVTGKPCPRPFVDHPERFTSFKKDVSAIVNKPTKVMWDGREMKRGQVGRLVILKPIKLWKTDSRNKLVYVRTLGVGQVYPVYGFREDYFGQYNVGAGHWVTNMKGYVRYETPSQSKLDQLKLIYG